MVNVKDMLVEDLENVELMGVWKWEGEEEGRKGEFVYDKLGGMLKGFVRREEKDVVGGDVVIDENGKYVEGWGVKKMFVMFVGEGNYEKVDVWNWEEMVYIKGVEGQNELELVKGNIVEVVKGVISDYE